MHAFYPCWVDTCLEQSQASNETARNKSVLTVEKNEKPGKPIDNTLVTKFLLRNPKFFGICCVCLSRRRKSVGVTNGDCCKGDSVATDLSINKEPLSTSEVEELSEWVTNKLSLMISITNSLNGVLIVWLWFTLIMFFKLSSFDL